MKSVLSSVELSELFVAGFRPFDEATKQKLIASLQSRLSSGSFTHMLYHMRLMKLIGELKKVNLAFLSNIFFKQSENVMHLVFHLKSALLSSSGYFNWRVIKIELVEGYVYFSDFKELYDCIDAIYELKPKDFEEVHL